MPLNQPILCLALQGLQETPPFGVRIKPDMYAMLKNIQTSLFAMTGLRPDPKAAGALIPVIPSGLGMSMLTYKLNMLEYLPVDVSAITEAMLNVNMVPDLPPTGYMMTYLKTKLDLQVPKIPIPDIDFDTIRNELKKQVEKTVTRIINSLIDEINIFDNQRTEIELNYQKGTITRAQYLTKLRELQLKIDKLEIRINELRAKISEVITFEIPLPPLPIKTTIQSALERCQAFYNHYTSGGVI